MCGPSGAPLLRARQRGPGADRALARAAADRAVSRASLPDREGGGSGRPRHVRELPDHRLPAAAVPRPRLLQRLSRVARPFRGVPRPPAQPGRRPTARAERAQPREPAQRRAHAGARARLAGARGLRLGCGGHVRLRLDRRAVPGGRVRGRLEVRPDGRAPRTEAGARRRPDPYAEAPFPASRRWPRVSVVVCTYNGARTIRDCLDGLVDLDYPDFEVIVTRIGYRSTWRCADARSSG
ncbi:MAG: glycosyltransferase [Deltaproteobacteria bacterium]|nr:MAG: glycosyltransferase [Deltaproteobacteria bacterium]